MLPVFPDHKYPVNYENLSISHPGSKTLCKLIKKEKKKGVFGLI